MPALTVRSPVLDMAEGISASSNPSSGPLTKLVVIGTLVVVAAVAARKWFFPYTIEHLEGLVREIDDLIAENTTLDWNLLGDSTRYFKPMLERYVSGIAHLVILTDFCLSDSSRRSPIPAYTQMESNLDKTGSCAKSGCEVLPNQTEPEFSLGWSSNGAS